MQICRCSIEYNMYRPSQKKTKNKKQEEVSRIFQILIAIEQHMLFCIASSLAGNADQSYGRCATGSLILSAFPVFCPSNHQQTAMACEIFAALANDFNSRGRAGGRLVEDGDEDHEAVQKVDHPTS